MLSDEVIDKVVERLAVRMEQANEYVLQEIGKSIKKIGTLSPSKAQQLIQIIRYGGDYQKIVKKIKEITKLNIKDIEKIFKEVAKNDYDFAKQFYDYKKKKYIPWDENKQLQEQIKALAKITAKEYVNMTKAMAFATYENGKIKYTEISKMYQKVLDEAVLNVGQGKETFDNEMYRILKQLGESGIRVIDYPSGRSIRADSAVRMQMKSSLRNMHNEIQQQFGEEFDADGVEISVHLNPAPDHEKVQGKQFSLKEFEKFQNDEDARSYDGILFPAISEETGHDRRAISQYNCYHYVFSIVLGVNKPQYSNEELQEIIDRNNKGFELDGKHYTNYQGTQLQRQLETEIRKQKDTQILARASNNDKLIAESQQKISQLTSKYKELSKASGLPTSMERMRVSGYRQVKVSNPIIKKESNNTVSLLTNKNEYKFNTYQDNLSKTDKSYMYNKVYTYDIKNGGKADNVQVSVSKRGYVWNNALLSDNIKGKGEGTKIALDLNKQSIKETGYPLRSLPEYNIVGIKNHTEEGKGLWDSLVRKGYATKNDDNTYTMLDTESIEHYTKEEKAAINTYISPQSIVLNEKLRTYQKLTDSEAKIVNNLDSVLEKTKNYSGNIVRSMKMPNPEDFINQLKINEEFSTNQYLSFSVKEGYHENPNIKIYIENSMLGKDFRKLNTINEGEILYPRNQKFIVKSITKRNNIYYILWEEKK